MADEITFRLSVLVQKGTYRDQINLGQISVDQSVQGRGGYVQEIGTAEEALDFGDVAIGTINTEGWLFLQNLDTTNYITYGPQVGTGGMEVMGKVKPGEPAWFRLEPGTIVMAKANVATCKLDVRLYAD